MKKTCFIFSLLSLIFYQPLIAQTGMRFGFKAGYNIATQYGIKPADLSYEVDSDPRNAFTGGIVLFFPVTEAFGVQQEFLYSQKGSGQNISMTQPPMTTSTDYKINYFEMPLLFRYNFVNIGKLHLYGSSGFVLSVLLDGKYSVDGMIDMGAAKVPIKESGNTDGLDTFDYSFIYGFGFQMPLLKKDCFFDYRQTIGWNTLQMPTSAGGEPAPLRNQTYTLTIGMYL
jgi:hypothetical protein